MLIRAPQTPFVVSHLQTVCFQQPAPAVLLQRTASGSLQIWAEPQDSREPKTVQYGNMKAHFPYFRLGQAPSFLAGSYFLWDRYLKYILGWLPPLPCPAFRTLLLVSPMSTSLISHLHKYIHLESAFRKLKL